MSTPAQITANRLNAQKSTGPRTDEGKAVSRFNALKHGASAKSPVIPGEDENDLARISASYRERYRPVGPEEALLVEKIIAADWTQRRMHWLESDVLNALIAQQDEFEDNPIGTAYINDCQGANALQKIFRCREAAGREWYRAVNELRARQACRELAPPPPPVPTRPVTVPQPPPPPAPAPRAAYQPVAAPPSPKIGFVFDETTPPAWRL